MNRPFIAEEFLMVLQNYNQAIWPAHVIGYLLDFGALWLVFKPVKQSGQFISGFLGLRWIWMGAVYHLGFFATINPATRMFGVLFILQGILFLYAGTWKRGLTFRWENGWQHYIGATFIVYALLIYPILSALVGHRWPVALLFGVAPCPSTIFTFATLLLTVELRKYVLIIPLLWSLIGVSAAVNFGIVEDYGMVIAGLVGAGILPARKQRTAAAVEAA